MTNDVNELFGTNSPKNEETEPSIIQDNDTKKITHYYIIINGKQEGPYSIDELNALSINRKTLVWCNGMTDWASAETVDKLSSLFLGTPPPFPNNIENASTTKMIIPTPIDVNVNKVKSNEDRLKRKRNSKVAAKEIITTFKIIGITLIATFLFYLAFYLLEKPAMISEENQRIFNEKFSERERESGTFYMAFGDLYSEYLGYCDYDDGIPESGLKDINNYRLGEFENDIQEKAIYFFLILIGSLIIGRYLIMFIKWLIANGRTE